ADDPAPTEPATDAQGRPIAAGRYIVVLGPTADTAAVTTKHRQRDGIRADRTFTRAIRGFTARLDAAQRRALAADPSIVAIVSDEVIELAGQVNPTGISRVGARQSAVADIDNVDERVDADVAIVDTGVALHSDLNVVGGVNCSTSDRSAWTDDNGHGTHVAGTVAAKDNTFGVVGVAPGARIWAVRILNADGYGLLSWYICGLDWILAQKDPSDSTQPLIEAVNMSVAKSGGDDQNCGFSNSDVLHRGICRLYSAGITVVAAAANESLSASNFVPAAYNEVITTSALADTDGVPGGRGGNLCYSWGTYDKDDTFADFSNYGSDIDIIAPGKCIWSTLPGGYGYSSGTSMAAPAVTGAVALYKASRPDATPAEVRESLRYLGNFGWATSTDPDNFHEPLLDVSRVSNLGTFSIATPSAVVDIPSRGGTATVSVNVVRNATFFERVRLGLTGLPAGWSASLGTSSLFGWTARATTVRLTVPTTADAGRYQFTVVGTNWGRTRTATITVEVAAQAPFTDTDAFQSSIDWLYREGITGGCTPTLFCPKDRVTRIQMAMFLTRAFDLATTTSDYFDDDDGMTGESSVNALRKAGWTAG
ncbi:MAG: S8 family serine peptidase, partial [Candidatus Limnocylindrales bacterium]